MACAPFVCVGYFGSCQVLPSQRGMMQLASLDDESFQPGAARVDGRVHVEPESGRGVEPAPVGDVAILDDDVVAAVDPDGADRLPGGLAGGAGPLEREAAEDHVGGVDRDALVVLVAHVDGRAPAVVDAPGAPACPTR